MVCTVFVEKVHDCLRNRIIIRVTGQERAEARVLLSRAKSDKTKALPVETRAIKAMLLVTMVLATIRPLYVFFHFSSRHRDKVAIDNVHSDRGKDRATLGESNKVNRHIGGKGRLVLARDWKILFPQYRRRKLLGQELWFPVLRTTLYLLLHSLHHFDELLSCFLLLRRPRHCFRSSNSHLVSKII